MSFARSRMPVCHVRQSLLLLSTALVAFTAQADVALNSNVQLDAITVVSTGVSSLLNASVGDIGQAQIASQPLLRPAAILENVPGLIVTQHSGEGKANQYFLRGFNLDHGTDLAITVDDMPINMRTHAHGQGYADLNFLMPEAINALDIRKGPFFADVGDFGNAGSLSISLKDTVQQRTA